MNFNYPHTCPDICEGLGNIKRDVEHHVEALLIDIELEVEKVRSTNKDMRDAAEDQITELLDEIDDLKSEIDDLKEENQRLQDEVDRLILS